MSGVIPVALIFHKTGRAEMLHGCQKKIYHVRNVGGKYFNEAYLVLRDGLEEAEYRAASADLATEADRIIKEAAATVKRRRAKSAGGVRGAVMFALGALSSSAVIGTAALIFFGG